MSEHVFGTEPYKLVRSHDPDTSQLAARMVNSQSWEVKIYLAVSRAGLYGLTPKEALAAHPDAPYSTVTARFKALKDKGLIVDTGQRRDRSAVLVDAQIVYMVDRCLL